MALHKRVRRDYGGKLSVSIKYQNLHFFKEGMILLCQSILEMRRIRLNSLYNRFKCSSEPWKEIFDRRFWSNFFVLSKTVRALHPRKEKS